MGVASVSPEVRPLSDNDRWRLVIVRPASAALSREMDRGLCGTRLEKLVEAALSTESPTRAETTSSTGNNGATVPHLAEGVELLGEYEGSGYKDPRYLARRSDGVLIQLTELLYLVAEAIDGRRTHEEIADYVRERSGKQVTPANVQTLIDKNLLPDGFVRGRDGAQPQLKKPDPLLALKLKVTLLPEGAVNGVAGALRPLFWPPVIAAVLIGLTALDVWYFGVHGIAQSLRDLIYQPLIVLLIYGLLVVSIAWHELGHATACRYGGARPGRIGFGIYIVWPAFFTDVTAALTLGKGGRVRTDLGGLYFNAIFSLLIGGTYFISGFEPILLLIVMQHLLMLYNLMPFLRLDGYHAISDLTGIPDLFKRIKPTLRGMAPWKETPDEVSELKRWARVVVTAWVLLVIPILLYFFAMMVLSAPRALATAWDSLLIEWDKIRSALNDGEIAEATVGGIQGAMIVLPSTGMFVSFSRVAKRVVAGFWSFTSERPLMRTSISLGGVAAVAGAIFVLLPNGDYRPIQPNERWTFSDGLRAASEFSTGRPSLTPELQKELHGARSLHETGRGFTPSYDRNGGNPTPVDPTKDSVDVAPNGDNDPATQGDETSTDGSEPSPSPTEEPSPTPTESSAGA